VSRRHTLRRTLLLGGTLLLGVLIILLAADRVLGAPRSDLDQLAIILSISGTVSLLLGGVAVRWGGRRVGSLRLRLALTFGVGLLVAIANVAAASVLMFLSGHDLTLLLLLLLFAAVISTVFGSLAAGAVTEDLGVLAAAAGRLAEGDLQVRVRPEGRDEVARLAAAFDRMADRLEAAFTRERALETDRRDLIASVSHDLRTPLATTRAMIEAITDGVVADRAEIQRYLTLILHEVHHLNRLIDDLFELSQIEAGALQLRLEPVRLPDLLASTLAAYGARARDQGVVLEHTVAPALPPALADAARLQRVVRNLIDNALHQTPPGGCIRVVARRGDEAETARVSVYDTGPGVPPAEQARIFERFYRGERSRQRGESAPNRSVGAGLGLTIAHGLVRAHHGRIWVESTAHGGAAFHFTVPLVRGPSASGGGSRHASAAQEEAQDERA